MNPYSYNSKHQKYIEDFLELKQALGFDYKMGKYWLYVFDKFCISEFPESTFISKDIVLKWVNLRPGEHINNLQQRIHYIRQLALYMNQTGTEAYVIPKDYTRKIIRYIPHIFTSQELSAFFYAVDGIEFRKSNPARSLVLPMIFRLLYCSGLRPSEAVNLRAGDVDIDTGKLIIRQAKGNKDRVVVIAYDVLELCQKYNDKVGVIWPCREWFFPNDKGIPYTAGYISDLFRKLWNKTGIKNVSGNKPRLYDMRHSFCVKRMNLWVKESRDLNALLPFLSMYMGHSSFAKTDYYLHLVPDFYPELIERSVILTNNVIPEVDK
ncbi:tyrosine-type recombinase/integrase [Sporosarcina sp. BP05]|uniref:tyrosine-type recombinase/integrase n=1 Tax=Sporosarcina sp. BP05 TaxID=2758726 RepID=UPI001646EEA2|nr:tyrosine-type recombinase/integrase [Sporosarcina sp. BP05]